MKQYKYAVVHGRFQPFHNEHLAYFKWAKVWGNHLFIGITNFDRFSIKKELKNSHRHLPSANPFSYWERSLMIKDALIEAGFNSSEFTLVALPIHTPEKWSEFVPTNLSDSVHLLRIFSDWELEKANRLIDLNYRVITEKPALKILSASVIRMQIAENDYENLQVPLAVKHWLRVFDSTKRIKELISCNDIVLN